jgi:hypothetical protein
MTRFEYQVLKLKTFKKLNAQTLLDDANALNLIGMQGWRIVAHSQTTVVFMRKMGFWKRIKLWKRT